MFNEKYRIMKKAIVLCVILVMTLTSCNDNNEELIRTALSKEYPDEPTLENWEQFIGAPRSVMNKVKKDLESKMVENPTNDPILKANPYHGNQGLELFSLYG